MAIPESQLETWAHQGSIAQSSVTYNTIKTVLESKTSPFADKSSSIFLQGSYGNDTNIYSESDVDIVIRLDSCFYHDANDLPYDQKIAFNAVFPPSSTIYGYLDFKKDVLDFISMQYGTSVVQGNKAIKIKANGNRRNADILIAAEYRKYTYFLSAYNQSYVSGICFLGADSTLISNYPRQHSENCTKKHQATDAWFKPMVRILKNVRSTLVEQGKISADIAPSYYIEGLLYNVPNGLFGTSYEESFVKCINWIQGADHSRFLCANEQYYLLNEYSHVTWRASKCSAFLDAVCALWEQW